jgi:predicted nucleic acid-binding protein
VYYLDTSAAVKLVVAEKGSKALRRWLTSRDGQIASSDLLRTELLQATRRAAPEQMVQARAVLDALVLVTMSTDVFEQAARFEPAVLRSLDSLHLAAALEFGDELAGIVTYDKRLADGCKALGIRVVTPS